MKKKGICANHGCNTPLKGNQTKYCCKVCRIEAHNRRRSVLAMRKRIAQYQRYNLSMSNKFADILGEIKFCAGLPSGLHAQFNPMGGE